MISIKGFADSGILRRLIFIIILLILIDQLDIITHNLQLGNAGIIFFLLSSLRKSVTHDSDKHIQEHNHNQEGREQEQDVAHRALVMSFHIRLRVELTQAELIHNLKGVPGPEWTDIRH